MNKLLLAALLACASLSPVSAAKAWHLVVDGNRKVPVAQIDYIIQQPDAQGFDVVLATDGVVVENVKKSTFAFDEEASVDQLINPKETIIGPFHGVVTIKGINGVAPNVAVYNSAGVLMERFAPKESTFKLDISSYPPGVYLLVTPRSAVKFIKK